MIIWLISNNLKWNYNVRSGTRVMTQLQIELTKSEL